MHFQLKAKLLLISLLLSLPYLWGKVTGPGEVNFDVDNNDQNEMTLTGNGLGIGISSHSANLHVQGNTLVSGKMVVGGTNNISNSNLHIQGTIAYSNQSVTSGTHAVSNTSIVFADTSAGNVTLQLPDAGANANLILTIKRTSDQNILYLAGGGNYVEGYTTMSFPSGNYTSITLVNNGTSWYILDFSDNISQILEEVSSDNLVLWWKLDETSGNIVTDYSSAANVSGNLTNSHYFSGNSTIGVIDQALTLDDSLDTVLHKAASNLSYQSYSYSLWAHFSSNSSDTIDVEPNIEGKAGFVWASSNKFYHMSAYHQLTNGTYVSTNIQSTPTLYANTWYHIAVSWNSVSDNLQLYLNGNLESGNVAASWRAGTNIVLTNPGTHNNPITKLDEFRFFDKPLLSGDVEALYNSGNP
jgi:hypothetical protein